MKTIETEQWGSVWKKDLEHYDSGSVLPGVEEESSGVRATKIINYLEEHISTIARKRTVEIGCGGATYSLILARLGATTTLLDYSRSALTLAERNFCALNLQGEVIQADAFNLPGEMLAQYDVAMSFGTVEHYRDPLRQKICKSHLDLVRPGGVVIISTPNVFFLPHEILKLLLIARGKWFLGYEGSLSRYELSRVGRKLGLEHIRIVGSSWKSDLSRYAAIVRDTQTFRRWFGRQSEAGLVTTTRPQIQHWLDDHLGHDIVLLGVKAAL